ncbi:unnamed protein product, partial [Iphiclides podalirius]
MARFATTGSNATSPLFVSSNLLFTWHGGCKSSRSVTRSGVDAVARLMFVREFRSAGADISILYLARRCCSSFSSSNTRPTPTEKKRKCAPLCRLREILATLPSALYLPARATFGPRAYIAPLKWHHSRQATNARRNGIQLSPSVRGAPTVAEGLL